MTTEQVSKPVALAVSMAEAKETLRIEMDDTALDATIAIWIKGITAHAEHETGGAFVNRPVRLALDSFHDALRLDRSPAFSVEAVRYMDVDGQMQTLDPTDYYVDKVTRPAYIVPARGKAWPATADHVNAVVVEYTSGYGPDHTTVPDAANLYILARLAELFDPAAREFKETQASAFVGKLLESIQVY